MVTIFTTTKPFTGEFDAIQRNAFKSWKKLRPEQEIILFDNEPGAAKAASDFGIIHIPEVERNEQGTPLISDMFEKAQLMAKNELLVYVNADIILMSDFLKAVSLVSTRHSLKRFLMVGRRWDMNITQAIDFEESRWEEKLRAGINREGKLHGFSGIDYFVFPKGLFDNVPPFAIGRTSWDNWLLYKARSKGAVIVDATKAITIVHQNHTYSHHPQGKAGVWKGEEAKKNLKLAGGVSHLLNIRDADFLLTESGLEKKNTDFYHLFSLPFRHFEKSSLWLKPFLFPGWLAFVLWRKIKIMKS